MAAAGTHFLEKVWYSGPLATSAEGRGISLGRCLLAFEFMELIFLQRYKQSVQALRCPALFQFSYCSSLQN